jgi:hypothetical protein
MISLELAKKLRDAGLRWEPKEGDYCYYDEKLDLLAGENLASTVKLHNLITKNPEYQDMGPIWVPSLDQLLGEIEARGWEYEQGVLYVLGGPMMPGKHKHGYWCEIWSIKDLSITCREPADTPEEAAGRALLWILERSRDEQGD